MNAMNSRAINVKAINSGTHRTSNTQAGTFGQAYKLLGHLLEVEYCDMSLITTVTGQSTEFKVGYSTISVIPSIHISPDTYVDGFKKLDICSSYCPVYPYDF